MTGYGSLSQVADHYNKFVESVRNMRNAQCAYFSEPTEKAYENMRQKEFLVDYWLNHN